ncbi:hypothetical protein HAX54_047279 [Datura stramonium]|uniref:Uncharacterized protein n=1 Tax=Datura stramonium TaxID=4076 RepID=A0ABS8WLT6_DATST|nr:hypothetical protein [Datura stramonium]
MVPVTGEDFGTSAPPVRRLSSEASLPHRDNSLGRISALPHPLYGASPLRPAFLTGTIHWFRPASGSSGERLQFPTSLCRDGQLPSSETILSPPAPHPAIVRHDIPQNQGCNSTHSHSTACLDAHLGLELLSL